MIGIDGGQVKIAIAGVSSTVDLSWTSYYRIYGIRKITKRQARRLRDSKAEFTELGKEASGLRTVDYHDMASFLQTHGRFRLRPWGLALVKNTSRDRFEVYKGKASVLASFFPM